MAAAAAALRTGGPWTWKAPGTARQREKSEVAEGTAAPAAAAEAAAAASLAAGMVAPQGSRDCTGWG